MKSKILAIFGIGTLIASLFVVPPALAKSSLNNADNRSHPLRIKQQKLKEKALEAKLQGEKVGKIHEVAKGQFVELEREGEDLVWTVLGEFSDFPHNNIAEPDRSVNNTTLWPDDFSREYFRDLVSSEAPGANSMYNYYVEQSSNRYAVSGAVTDWVALPDLACNYDDGNPGPGSLLALMQFLIDSVDGWYNTQVAAGVSDTAIAIYLSNFDVWDRYDYDGDGNFDEPDGYIDHIQFVHAGEGNEAGGGALGDCAIWSQTGYAYEFGSPGPAVNPAGGIQIGNSDYWVGDYSVLPENGGLGLFVNKYAKDLGLPDLYDYSGENSTGFWTLMSSGYWLSQNNEDIGSQPNHLGAWEKFQLGWLNYEVAFAGTKSTHRLGPAETNTKEAQGLFVVLPPKEVTEEISDPYSGSYFYYSGKGNDLDNFMYKAFNLGTVSSLVAMVNFDIEVDWDYAYLVVSTDSGATWQSVPTSLSTNTDPNGQNFGYGITGNSGGWTVLSADLSAFTGDVLLGFRYWTDVGVVEPGFMVDDISVSGYPIDGAESDMGWTFEGFIRTTGIDSKYYSNYYVAEFRQYRGYDAGLANAYNFGWNDDPLMQNWVEHFPYQDGLLISYWDTSFADNNVGNNCADGRCGGLLLPIDAHPEIMYRADGGTWRNRVQSYDSTFGLDPT